MEIEKMTYSRSKVNECMEIAKKFNITVTKKCNHYAKAIELKDIFEKCYENTNCLLFDYEWCYMKNYLNMSYDYMKHTKKELDQMERTTYNYLVYQIEEIIKCMENGDVNVIE